MIRPLVILLCLAELILAGCSAKQTALVSAHGKPVSYWIGELKNPQPKARIAAINALQSVGAFDAAAIPALIRALGDADAKVRDAAALALLNIGPPAKDAVEALNKAKSDNDPTVRKHAAAALQQIAPNG